MTNEGKLKLYNRRQKKSFNIFFQHEILPLQFSSNQFDSTSNVNSQFNFNEFYYIQMFQTNDGPAINTYAWDYILLKNFPKAVQILEKGLLLLNKSQEIYPFLLINLAHAYLLTNQFEKAHAIYFENLKMKLNDKSWESIIHEDFKDFKKRGIYTPQMEQIEEELLVINAKYEKDRLLSLENQQSKEEAEEQRKIEQRIKSEKKEKRIRTFNKIISIGVKN